MHLAWPIMKHLKPLEGIVSKYGILFIIGLVLGSNGSASCHLILGRSFSKPYLAGVGVTLFIGRFQNEWDYKYLKQPSG